MKIKLKRVYDPISPDDGFRILVDRLWPRGIKKGVLKIDAWLKEIAPSTPLRKWFSHDPLKWKQFQIEYAKELDLNHTSVQFIEKALHQGPVTFLFSSKNLEHNHAIFLKHYLEKRR